MKRKIVSLLLAVVILGGIIPHTVLAAQIRPVRSEHATATLEMLETNLVEEFGSEFAQNYLRAQSIRREIRESLPRTRAGDIIYPADFGGYYIDDNGNLVVLVVGSREDSILTPLTQNDGVIVREVEFSENELITTMEYLRGLVLLYYPDLDRNANPNTPLSNVNGWTLDVVNNRVTVDLYDYSPESIENFRRTIHDSHDLAFQQAQINHASVQEFESMQSSVSSPAATPAALQIDGESAITPFRTISPGAPIAFWRQTGSNFEYRGGGGIGYLARTRVSNRNGFVTVSHGVAGIASIRRNDVVTLWACGTIIGNVYSVTGYRSGHDASFIQLNAGITLTRNVPHGSLDAFYARPRVGDIVWNNGAVSGLRGGRLVVERRDNAHHGFWVFNAAHTAATAQAGDSGSIVYFVDGNWIDVLGIVIGSSSVPGANTTVSRAEYINSFHNTPQGILPGLNLNLR